MKRTILLALCCALLTTPGLSGLFSSGKLSMRQSFTTSYLSSGKQGVFTNLYTNTVGYRISDKLQMELGLGYRFTPSAGKQPASRFSAQGNRGMFLPSFSMRYQPSDAVVLQFNYQTIDPYQPQWWGR